MIDPISARLLRGAGLVPTQGGRGPVVLMYHGVHAGRDPGAWRWSVPAERFEAQMRFLKRHGWTTLRVCDLADRDNLPKRAVVVSFDDGFRDNYEHAVPLLLEQGMTATWFVATRDIGGLAGWRDSAPSPRPMLSREQLCEMAAAGMEIAAHTRTHPDLTTLSEEQQEHEIAGSKADLEAIVGREVTSLAYPFGRFDERSLAATTRGGFALACTSNPGWLGSDAHPLRIRRVAVFAGDTVASLARKIAFADTEVGFRRVVDYAIARLKARATQ